MRRRGALAALLAVAPLAGGCGEAPEPQERAPAPNGPGVPATVEPAPEATAEPADSAPVPNDPEGDEAEAVRGPYAFRDVTEAAGLAGFRQVNGGAQKPFIVETVGGGVALVDVDGDDDLDAYLTNGSAFEPLEETPRDALYLNDGRGRFTDATERAGLGDARWTNGVRAADYDGDGDVDLYLTNYGPNVLYRNRGDGTFEDVTAEAGVGVDAWSTGACFLDFDRDGDLDLYVANYVDFDEEHMLRTRPTVAYKGVDVMKGPRGLPGAGDRFFVNDGAGRFEDATERLGIAGPELFGFQCVAFDFDGDHWVDVYVANDSVGNLLWKNLEGRGFRDVASITGLALSMNGMPQAGMGVALGDYDGDLRTDLFVTNFADDYFTLYRATERGTFVDGTARLKLVEPTRHLLGWACGFDDFDNDGDLEIWAATGHVYPQVDRFEVGTSYLQRNALFEYEEGGFRVPEGAGGPGFALEAASRGGAVGDVDGDGDLDLLFGNLDGPPTLLRNDGPSGNWLRLRLVGPDGNRDAVGASVVVRVGERRHLRLVSTAAGFLSSSEPWLHVGLGDAQSVDEVGVRWPGGRIETLGAFEAGSRLVIEAHEEGARVRALPR